MEKRKEKTLHNSASSDASKNVEDIKFWGDGDTFKLISKASSKGEGWMKSTKAMEIENVGCVVQVTTQQGDNIAEAVCFVPAVMIVDVLGDDAENPLVVSRYLAPTLEQAMAYDLNKTQLENAVLAFKREMENLTADNG